MASATNPRRFAIAAAAVLSSAAMLWFGAGLDPAWPLMWFAPLPLLVLAPRVSWSLAAVAAFVAWFLGTLSFWHYMVGVLGVPVAAYVAIFGIASLVFASAVLLFRALLLRRAYWSAVIAFPAAWVAFEFVNNLTSPHGTAGSLSYTQLKFLPFLQFASVAGPWGMTFKLLLFSAGGAVGIEM